MIFRLDHLRIRVHKDPKPGSEKYEYGYIFF